MKIIRAFFLAILVMQALSWFSIPANQQPDYKILPGPSATEEKIKPDNLKEKIFEVKKFIQQKNFNNDVCFLIDMSLPSGQKRFFIYDLKKDSVRSKGLVAHGNCYQSWLEGRRYSNKVGSGCTSVGKYRIGQSYSGKFGYSYKLYGLDSSNSNAFERTVVLHEFEKILLHCFYDSFYLRSEKEKNPIFEKAINELNSNKDAEIQAPILDIFNFQGWLLSRLQKISYKEFVSRKFTGESIHNKTESGLLAI